MWFQPYQSIATRREKAKKLLARIRKKNPQISPVVIEGKKIANTWWGKAWNNNLKCYADYDYRISRGRSCLRNGFVFHLEIKEGYVKSLVSGSGSHPYNVEVKVDRLSNKKWERIKNLCRKHLHSLTELYDGKFPKELDLIFSNNKEGVFPSPNEMKFSCSCPDWANMCKHVSATLFAIGAGLDKDSKLIFKLRKVDVNDLIERLLKEEKVILEKKKILSSDKRLGISDKKLEELFNVKLDSL